MATKTRDFASAGANAAMRDRAAAKGGLHLVKTISRASEGARDRRRYDPKRDEREPAPRPDIGDFTSATPEQRAYETVNYVLRTLGGRLGAAGLVSLPALDRALTSATAAVLFSAEASPLFESLRSQAHDLVLVNSVFCAIYFIGFLTARIAGTVPNYDTKKSGELAMKIIEELFHAAIGEEATKGNQMANDKAYKTLRTATGLLRPTDSGPGIFPGFPKLESSAYSNDGFFKVRAYLKDFDDIADHFVRNGFPQPVIQKDEETGKPMGERIEIKDWKFLSSDENTRRFEVSHADRHIGEKAGRVTYWLICSAHRLQPGQAVIVYHQQHIQLVRWLGNRFGYRVLTAATDLSWTGKHWEISNRLKAVMRDWLIIVPTPKRKSERRSSKMTVRTMDSETSTMMSSPRSPTQRTIQEQAETWNLQQKAVQVDLRDVRRSVRAGRSVSFATDSPGEPINRIISSSSTSESPGRAPLRSAMKPAGSNSPPRPPRPEERDIPDMNEMGQSLDEARRRSALPAGTLPLSTDNIRDLDSRQARVSGSPTKPLSPGAGLPPFVSDMSNKRSSSESMKSSSGQSQSASGTDRSSSQPLSRQATRTNESVMSDPDERFGTPPEGVSPITEEVPDHPGVMYSETPLAEKSAPSGNMTAVVPSDEGEISHLSAGSVSPVLGGATTPREVKADAAAHSGIADSPNDTPVQDKPKEEFAQLPSTGQNSLEPPGMPIAHSEDLSRPSSFVAASTASTTSVAPSWPSSVASIPSSVPDTPMVLRSSSVSSTTASSTQPARSNTSSSRRKAPLPPKKVVYATVLYDFDPQDPREEIPIREGGRVEVIERTHELEQDGWCKVKAGDLVGLVPVAYLDIEPAVVVAAGGPIMAASKGNGAESVSARSDIGHLATANHDRVTITSEQGTNAHPDPQYSSWTDLDTDDFNAEEFVVDATGPPLMRLSSTSAALSDLGSTNLGSKFHSRQSSMSTTSTATAGPMGMGHSRTSSVIRARIWNTQNDFFTGLSDSLPQSLGSPLSQASSVTWSAGPEPMMLRQLLQAKALTLQNNQREEEADDDARTPKPEDNERLEGNYFETASRASVVSARRGSVIEVGRRKGESKGKGKEKEPPTVASPTPRFWDNVSGTVGIVPLSAYAAFEEVGEEGENMRAEPLNDRDQTSDMRTPPSEALYNEPGADGDGSGDITPTKSESSPPPRFWDNVSGIISAATTTRSTSSNDDQSTDHDDQETVKARVSSGSANDAIFTDEATEESDEKGKMIELRDAGAGDIIDNGDDVDARREPSGSNAEFPAAVGAAVISAPAASAATVETGTQADPDPEYGSGSPPQPPSGDPESAAQQRGSAQPRFWDDVSGGILGHASSSTPPPPSNSGCRQS